MKIREMARKPLKNMGWRMSVQLSFFFGKVPKKKKQVLEAPSAFGSAGYRKMCAQQAGNLSVPGIPKNHKSHVCVWNAYSMMVQGHPRACSKGFSYCYPLVNSHIAMENHHF